MTWPAGDHKNITASALYLWSVLFICWQLDN